MKLTLGFDVYGTLIDTHGVIVELEKSIGDDAPHFSQTWRDKQLEYTFRRGVMRKYQHFGICTRQALEHTAQTLGHDFSEDQKQTLLNAYSTLPPFRDAVSGLHALQDEGHEIYAFSNGRRDDVNTVLTNARIREFFIDIVSVDEIETFKPNPDVYHHFLRATNSLPGNAWLISGNGFDVIGALAIGMKAAWIRRSDGAKFDLWEYQPTITLDSLINLPSGIASTQK